MLPLSKFGNYIACCTVTFWVWFICFMSVLMTVITKEYAVEWHFWHNISGVVVVGFIFLALLQAMACLGASCLPVKEKKNE